MHRRSRPGWALLASLTCGWFFAAGARAQSAGFQMPQAGSPLEPGTSLEVSWTLGEPLPPDFDEMELVLSLDGGRSFPLRVTRGISPATQSVIWRVPALPTEHARLALRSGSKEEPSSETVALIGPEFAIAVRPASCLEQLFRVRGEWGTQEATASPAESPFDASLGELPASEMRAGPAGTRAAQPPRSFTVERPGRSRTLDLEAETAAQEIEPSRAVAGSLFVPLRQ